MYILHAPMFSCNHNLQYASAEGFFYNPLKQDNSYHPEKEQKKHFECLFPHLKTVQKVKEPNTYFKPNITFRKATSNLTLVLMKERYIK